MGLFWWSLLASQWQNWLSQMANKLPWEMSAIFDSETVLRNCTWSSRCVYPCRLKTQYLDAVHLQLALPEYYCHVKHTTGVATKYTIFEGNWNLLSPVSGAALSLFAGSPSSQESLWYTRMQNSGRNSRSNVWAQPVYSKTFSSLHVKVGMVVIMVMVVKVVMVRWWWGLWCGEVGGGDGGG